MLPCGPRPLANYAPPIAYSARLVDSGVHYTGTGRTNPGATNIACCAGLVDTGVPYADSRCPYPRPTDIARRTRLVDAGVHHADTRRPHASRPAYGPRLIDAAIPRVDDSRQRADNREKNQTACPLRREPGQAFDSPVRCRY